MLDQRRLLARAEVVARAGVNLHRRLVVGHEVRREVGGHGREATLLGRDDADERRQRRQVFAETADLPTLS